MRPKGVNRLLELSFAFSTLNPNYLETKNIRFQGSRFHFHGVSFPLLVWYPFPSFRVVVILYVLLLQPQPICPHASSVWGIKEIRRAGWKGMSRVAQVHSWTLPKHEIQTKVKSKEPWPPLPPPSTWCKVRFSTFLFYSVVGEQDWRTQFNSIRIKLSPSNDYTYWKMQWERKFIN